MSFQRALSGFLAIVASLGTAAIAAPAAEHDGHVKPSVAKITIRSVANGVWSDAKVWEPARVPAAGDLVQVSRGTRIAYDIKSDAVIRSLHVAGTLNFAHDRDTELNVGYLKVQPGGGDDAGVEDVDQHQHGHAHKPAEGQALLAVGLPDQPIGAAHTAKIRLHYLDGMNKDAEPAIIARPGGRMEFHGAAINRTWVKLGSDAKAGDSTVRLGEAVTGWRVGDEVIVTASERTSMTGTFRPGGKRESKPQTEERRIVKIDGLVVTLDQPLANAHAGAGEFRSEIANLSRNVIIESADPAGVRGHTMYHWGSGGSISYARFAHLGKEGVLGRYPIHFHKVEDTMRGSSVVGASIVDSHNRWVTVHGTHYLLVRDCVGYQSVGHGYFLEDATEVFNVLDRNLGVQAYDGPVIKGQALPFDQNDGAAFWWSNGWNTITRNVGVESDQYGFRYDMQHSKRFDANLPVRQPDGSMKKVDVRTIPIWRFEANEAHGSFAGMVVAANGGSQPDTPIRDQRMLDMIRNVDWTGPDARHPHVIRDFAIWQSHYAFRPHSPSMLMENVRIDRANYGIYRPAFDNHVYRNLHLSNAGGEPFNRGMDDASAQTGRISVDGLTLERFRNDGQYHPLVHMSDNNLTGQAESHFRKVIVKDVDPKRAIFNRGGTVRVDPFLDKGVPYFIHDHFGPGRHAKIVSTKAQHLIEDGNEYRAQPPLTGDQSRVAEVKDVAWPKLLDPVDDLPPATIITSVRREEGKTIVRGVSHDNGTITRITVNDKPAMVVSSSAGVVDWQITLDAPAAQIVAGATDEAGNTELTPHTYRMDAVAQGH